MVQRRQAEKYDNKNNSYAFLKVKINTNSSSAGSILTVVIASSLGKANVNDSNFGNGAQLDGKTISRTQYCLSAVY